MANISIPCASVRPNRIVQYDYWDGDRKRSNLLPISNKQRNTISSKSSERLKSAIFLLCESATTKRIWDKDWQRWFSFKVNFITLTLPSKQVHADADIYRSIFKPFIRWWRGKNPSLLYIWKAEKQDNGNIHFHLTTNSFIHWRLLRSKWNSHCDSLGYLQRTSTQDPNSTDVHSVRDIQNLPNYLASYMSKKDVYKKPLKRYFRRYGKILKASTSFQIPLPKNYYNNIKENVKCKHWDCSKLLLNSKCTIIVDEAEIQKEIEKMYANNVEFIKKDYCLIWKLTPRDWSNMVVFRSRWQTFIAEVRRQSKLAVPLS